MQSYKIKILLALIVSTITIAQELEPEVTIARKKLIILASENDDSDIGQIITQIVSSTATQLNRYDIIDRNQLDKILNEQKLQHSGVVNPDQAIEIGKVAGANEALFISITNFGQKGIPTEKQEEKEEEEEPETGLFGWVVKEAVKATIDKEMEDVERYPNNIHTILNGEVRLLDVETGQSRESFMFNAEYTGGIKTKSLNEVLKKVRSQMVKNLKSLYQLSSEVLEVDGNKIILLLGKDMGVRSGTLFEIISRDEKRTVRDREITIPGKSVGFVKVETVSTDASESWVLRKWDEIEPGYQAHEITDGMFTGGISGIYGSHPENMRLSLFGNIKPFDQFGGSVYASFGTVQDTRDDTGFHFGLGFSLHYRLIQTSSFSLSPVFNIPFDCHMRTDDEAHTVFLPITSPRLGMQSEIMLSSNIDLVIRGEYVLTSTNLDNHWTYSEEQDDYETETFNANWNNTFGLEPEIQYKNWVIIMGIRSTFFSSFTFD